MDQLHDLATQLAAGEIDGETAVRLAASIPDVSVASALSSDDDERAAA